RESQGASTNGEHRTDPSRWRATYALTYPQEVWVASQPRQDEIQNKKVFFAIRDKTLLDVRFTLCQFHIGKRKVHLPDDSTLDVEQPGGLATIRSYILGCVRPSEAGKRRPIQGAMFDSI